MSTARRVLLAAANGGGAFTIPVSYSVSTITSAPEGGGVWFGSQRAIQNGSDVIAGYLRDTGDVRATIITAATRTVSSTTSLYDNFLDDDHEPPSFAVRADGKIMAAFSYHIGSTYIGIGASAGVLPSQFSGVTNITSQVGTIHGSVYGYTYSSLVYLPDESRYYLFLRYHDSGGISHVVFTYSDNDGVTWHAHTVLANITYHKVSVNGTGRIDVVLSDHPLYGQNNNPTAKTSIYHLYYESGAWHKSDGTTITLPVANTGASVVYNGTTERAWLWDIAVDGSGHPVIVFVIYANPFPSAAWRYGYARWSGSAWVVNTNVADAGGAIAPTATPEHGNNYAGGIALDPSSPNRVLYSSNRSGSFQVYLATTTDGGTTFTETQLTSDADKNVRPFWVHGHGDALQGMWWYGTYTDYFNYSQGIKGFGTP